MATRFSLICSAPPMINLNHVSTKGPTSSRFVVMSANNHISVDLHFKSSHNKVFEDRSAGIVCYRDENGEITCEGYDEGPRFHQQLSRFSYNTRDVEIIEILERCWVQVADERVAGKTDD